MENTTELVKVNQLNSVSEQVKDKYLSLVTSAQTAVMHLSKVQSIETKEDYEKAIRLLVKVKNTYNKIKSEREVWTKQLDEVKSFILAPEKLVSLEKADSGNEAHRVKKLADNWLTKENARIEAEKKEALKKQYAEEEKARIEGVVKTNIVDKLNVKINEIDANMSRFFSAITLENFSEKERQVKVTPKLKEAFYQEMFAVWIDEAKISVEAAKDFIAELMQAYPYSDVNDMYIKSAKPIIDEWVAKLPEKKKSLQEIAKAEKEDAEKAENLKKQQQEKEANEAALRKTQRDAEAEKAKTEIEVEKNIKQTNAMFETQVDSQAHEEVKGGRKNVKAVLTCETTDIIIVIGKILYANMTNPNYKGIVKVDKKTGEPLTDEDGNPVYENWLADILAEHARLNEKPVEGVKFIETRKATIRK